METHWQISSTCTHTQKFELICGGIGFSFSKIVFIVYRSKMILSPWQMDESWALNGPKHWQSEWHRESERRYIINSYVILSVHFASAYYELEDACRHSILYNSEMDMTERGSTGAHTKCYSSATHVPNKFLVMMCVCAYSYVRVHCVVIQCCCCWLAWVTRLSFANLYDWNCLRIVSRTNARNSLLSFNAVFFLLQNRLCENIIGHIEFIYMHELKIFIHIVLDAGCAQRTTAHSWAQLKWEGICGFRFLLLCLSFACFFA